MANIKYLVDLDLDNNQLKKARLENLDTHPGDVADGKMYFNTVDKVVYVYKPQHGVGGVNGAGWYPVDGDDQEADEVPFTHTAQNTGTNLTTSEGINTVQAAIEKVELYTPSVADSLTMPEDIGGILGTTTASDLKDRPISSILDDILFPTVEAYKNSDASVILSGANTSSVEVGTSFSQSLSIGLNRGTIKNGDGSNPTDNTLVGQTSSIQVNNPDGLLGGSLTTTSDSSNSISTTNYELGLGDNTWTVIVNHAKGNINNPVNSNQYEDNKEGTDVVADINALQDTVSKSKTFNKRAYYNLYSIVCESNDSPTTSSDVRDFITSSDADEVAQLFSNTSSTGTFTINVPMDNQVVNGNPVNLHQEVSIYVPGVKTVVANDPGNLNAEVAYTSSSITIDDNGGNPINYTKYTYFLGAAGYTKNTTFNITIS